MVLKANAPCRWGAMDTAPFGDSQLGTRWLQAGAGQGRQPCPLRCLQHHQPHRSRSLCSLLE